ncbi:MAG: pilus assembly protein [Hyphomicrobiales bacterium]|nr:pilus assembly protein [Hyphomicrobiales bacterium]
MRNLRHTLADFRAFAAHRGGNVMVLAALLAVPVTGGIGLAIDYGRALYAKQRLDAAAAAAAATAANSARFAYQQSGANLDNEDTAAFTEGQTRANAAFTAQTPSSLGATVSGTPTVNVSRNGSVVSSTVQYTASVATTLGGILGVSQISIGGQSAAAATIVQSVSNGFLIQESFETIPSAMQHGNWGVYQNYNGWVTTGEGVEVDTNCATECSVPDGKNTAELDSNGNSAMSKKVYLPTGSYELRYWYYSRVDNSYYDPVWVCGSTDADADWSNDTSNDWGAITNKMSVYLDPATGSTPNLTHSNTFSGYVGTNLIDSCTWSGQKWIERSVKINIVSPGYYWLTFTALGANDTYGGNIDNIRLCPNTCPGKVQENFPWAANTTLFTENFTGYGSAGSITNCNISTNSGSTPGWSSADKGWAVYPLNDSECWNGYGANGGGEIEMGAWNSPYNRTVSRRLLLDPGYYQVSYAIKNRLNFNDVNTSVYCGGTDAASQASWLSQRKIGGSKVAYLNTSLPAAYGAMQNASGMNGFSENLNWTDVFVDADRLFSHPVSGASLNSASSYANPDGTTSNLLTKLPSTVIDSCAYASTQTTRTVNIKIDKPGYYWLTFQAKSPDGSSYGGHVSGISVTALGGPSMTAPTSFVSIPAPAPAAGSTISFSGFNVASAQ